MLTNINNSRPPLLCRGVKMAKKETVCYVCEGSCKANISDERYKSGLVKCGAKGCTMHGKPFKKKVTRK